MSKLEKCDRCGMVYNYYQNTQNCVGKRYELMNGVMLILSSKHDVGYAPNQKFNLCPQCLRRVVNFLNCIEEK